MGSSINAGVRSFPTSPQYRRGWAIRITTPVKASVRKLAVTSQCETLTQRICPVLPFRIDGSCNSAIRFEQPDMKLGCQIYPLNTEKPSVFDFLPRQTIFARRTNSPHNIAQQFRNLQV